MARVSTFGPQRYYVEEPKEPDWLDVWALAMIDSALGVLRVIVKGGA